MVLFLQWESEQKVMGNKIWEVDWGQFMNDLYGMLNP